MTTKDLKAGDRILLAYGEQNGDLARCDNFGRYLLLDYKNASYKAWQATLEQDGADAVSGITYATVEGFETESGSIYQHDILAVMRDGEWVEIEHTPEELAFRQLVLSQ